MIAADLRVSIDVHDLAARAAEAVAQRLADAVGRQGSASIALSGGRTPQGLYRHLAARHRDDVPWDRRWVVATTAPIEPHDRLTLTLPAVTHAEAIYVLAAGRSKAEAIRRALTDEPDQRCPVSFIRTARGPIVWWLDNEAATLVIPENR